MKIKLEQNLQILKENPARNRPNVRQRANIPGIPEEMDARLEEAEEQLYIVMQSLQEVPLNMNLVNSNLTMRKNVLKSAEKAKK